MEAEGKQIKHVNRWSSSCLRDRVRGRRLLLRLEDEKIALDNNWIAWSYNFHLLNLQIRQTKHEVGAWPESEGKCQTKHTKMLFLTNRS